MESISEKIFDLLSKIPRSFYLPISLILISLVFIFIGLIQLLNPHKDIANQPIEKEVAATSSANTGALHVDIEGAVMRPGVYVLPQNSRVQDVLVAAGGLSAQSDRELVAKSINLASKVADGAKIYIPKIGDTVQNAQVDFLGARVILLDLNSATLDELHNLSGVGPTTAQKIINGRPYQSVNELLSKKIVSNTIFQKIKDKVTVN